MDLWKWACETGTDPPHRGKPQPNEKGLDEAQRRISHGWHGTPADGGSGGIRLRTSDFDPQISSLPPLLSSLLPLREALLSFPEVVTDLWYGRRMRSSRKRRCCTCAMQVPLSRHFRRPATASRVLRRVQGRVSGTVANGLRETLAAGSPAPDAGAEDRLGMAAPLPEVFYAFFTSAAPRRALRCRCEKIA